MIGGISSRNAATAQIKSAGSLINSDEYLQLFVTQIANQDPLEPMDNSEILSQMSHLTNISLMTDLSSNLQQIFERNEMLQAGALLGREVEYIGTKGAILKSDVKAVQVTDEGTVSLALANGEIIGMTSIRRVSEKPAPLPTIPTSNPAPTPTPDPNAPSGGNLPDGAPTDDLSVTMDGLPV